MTSEAMPPLNEPFSKLYAITQLLGDATSKTKKQGWKRNDGGRADQDARGRTDKTKVGLCDSLLLEQGGIKPCKSDR